MNAKTKILSLLVILYLIGISQGDVNFTDPNVTITPNVTEKNISGITVTPNITMSPNVTTTPNITITPDVTVTPNITAIPTTISTPNVTITPDVTVTPNITAIPTTISTPNVTVVPTKTPKESSSRKHKAASTPTPEKTISNATAQNATNQSIADQSGISGFGEFYDKVILAAALGFIGLIYEIIKIKYEHKKKNEVDKPKVSK